MLEGTASELSDERILNAIRHGFKEVRIDHVHFSIYSDRYYIMANMHWRSFINVEIDAPCS